MVIMFIVFYGHRVALRLSIGPHSPIASCTTAHRVCVRLLAAEQGRRRPTVV
jgi:hypothetical protein